MQRCIASHRLQEDLEQVARDALDGVINGQHVDALAVLDILARVNRTAQSKQIQGSAPSPASTHAWQRSRSRQPTHTMSPRRTRRLLRTTVENTHARTQQRRAQVGASRSKARGGAGDGLGGCGRTSGGAGCVHSPRLRRTFGASQVSSARTMQTVSLRRLPCTARVRSVSMRGQAYKSGAGLWPLLQTPPQGFGARMGCARVCVAGGGPRTLRITVSPRKRLLAQIRW